MVAMNVCRCGHGLDDHDFQGCLYIVGRKMPGVSSDVLTRHSLLKPVWCPCLKWEEVVLAPWS